MNSPETPISRNIWETKAREFFSDNENVEGVKSMLRDANVIPNIDAEFHPKSIHATGAGFILYSELVRMSEAGQSIPDLTIDFVADKLKNAYGSSSTVASYQ